jgi:hypothetical protein
MELGRREVNESSIQMGKRNGALVNGRCGQGERDVIPIGLKSEVKN